MGRKSIIYVDGFNLYFGALRRTPNKWLDLQTFFERRRMDDDIQVIRYYTALVDEPERTNQRQYLSALQTSEKIDINLGIYKYRTTRCGVAACQYSGKREFLRPEEKRSDVSLGTRMLDDAYQGLVERIVLVSGDTDLVPALQLIRERFPELDISILIPSRDSARSDVKELRTCASNPKRVAKLTPGDRLLSLCQFPNPVIAPGSSSIWKPQHW